jgi:signal transduction histidine kinase
LAYVSLAFSVTWTLLQPELSTNVDLTLMLAGVTAVWLLGFAIWWPAWPQRWAWSITGYLGLVALSCALIAISETFTAFVWIGYPFAFAMFPARWAVFAVTANSFLTVAANTGALTDPAALNQTSPYIVLLSVAGPVIFAGWYAGSESEKRKKAITQLTEALEENAGLHAQLLAQAREAGVLDERQRMAREIHDTLAQELAAMIRQLQAADRAREQPEQWQRHMNQVQTLARNSLAEARRSVRALRPEPLEHSRLPDAIAEMAQAWAKTSLIPTTVETTGTPFQMIPGIEVALFRVAQEALANVASHARASRAGITLSYLDDVVLLDIRDDGGGFDPASVAPRGDGGFGLGTMRQRLLGVGGTLEIESGPGEGTAIAASVPAIRVEGEAQA